MQYTFIAKKENYMIIDELKNANVQALKDKDVVARNLYGVLLNKIKLAEINKREKNEQLVDADVISILQKSLKELEDEKLNYQKVGNVQESENIERQMDIVKKFLPQMMSKQEIKDVILKLEDRSIPTVMKYFKQNFAGKCDMRLVSEVLKEI